jgi:hypothetical protein
MRLDGHAGPAGGLRATFRTSGAARPEREGPPRVLRIDPHDGAVGVFRDATIVARLTHPVDPHSLAPAAFEVHAPSGPVPGRFVASPDGEVLMWRAERPLEPGVEHEVRLHGLRDRDGRELALHRSGFVACDLVGREVEPP